MGKLYYWLLKKTSRPQERGQPSSGHWQSLARQAALELISPGQGSMLEIGCGEGFFLKSLPDSYGKVFGIDLSAQQLSRASVNLKGARRASTLQADAASLPFKDNSFDTVVCVNVFMNIGSDPAVFAALGNINRVCKTGGRLVLDVRNKLNPAVFLKYGLVGFYDTTIDAGHLRAYDPGKFVKILAEFGFELSRLKTIGFPWGRFAPIHVIEAVKRRRI